MKISFDYDGTLTEESIKNTAKIFIISGHDVWIITARSYGDFNSDLYKMCDDIHLEHDKIIITNGLLKSEEFFKGNFDLHYDDEWEEVAEINRKGGTAILVNPDFEDIYMKMQYKNNK
jgi:hydroxymethylpyrimidine pyrophosphatase-like HAD family hydrolase